MAKAKSTLGRMSGVMKAAVQKAARATESSGDGRGLVMATPQNKSERKAGRKNGVAPATKSVRKPAV